MIKLGYKASAEQFAPGKLLGFSCLAEEAVRGIRSRPRFCYQFGQRRVEPRPRRLSSGRRHDP